MAHRLSGRTSRPVSGLAGEDADVFQIDAFPCAGHSGLMSVCRSSLDRTRLPLRGQLRNGRLGAAPDSRFNLRPFGRWSPQVAGMVADKEM